jgi:hypothetical protein
MPVIHSFQSAQAAASNRALVDGPRWNASHAITLASVAAAATGNVANTTEVEEATGGTGIGITRTLPSAAANPGMVIRCKKMDSGAGTVTYVDQAGALIDGVGSYVLSNQYQYVVLQASTLGAYWNVIGNN